MPKKSGKCGIVVHVKNRGPYGHRRRGMFAQGQTFDARLLLLDLAHF